MAQEQKHAAAQCMLRCTTVGRNRKFFLITGGPPRRRVPLRPGVDAATQERKQERTQLRQPDDHA
jgi:hypothetical protein